MTTKDNFLLFKKRHKSFNYCDTGGQYSDVNLNQNLKGSNIFPIQSNSKSHNDKTIDYTLAESYEEKEKSQTWKKSSATDFCSTYSNSLSLNNEDGKCWKKNATNNSTLSLRISAYQNSNEVSADCLNKSFQKSMLIQRQKQINPASKFVSQSPFEFQRQQNDKVSEPEVSQFKASQRFLNLNKSDLHSNPFEFQSDTIPPTPQDSDVLQQQSPHHSATRMRQSPNQPIKAIVFDKDKNLACFGSCKLRFDTEQCLHIQVLDADPKVTFMVTFEGLCVRKNRYLYCQASENAVFLIFPDITKCEPIYNLFLALGRPQAIDNTAINEDKIFKDNFFLPIIRAIRMRFDGFKDLEVICKEFVNSLDDEIDYFHENLSQTFMVESSLKSAIVDSIGHSGILDFFDSPSEIIVNSSVPSSSSAIFEEFDNSWRSSLSGDEKLELIPFIKDEIADKISNYKAQPIVDILRNDKNEIVYFLAKCYEDAPENQLVNHVWNIVRNGSKFYGISVALLEVAATLETNRRNIQITKISSENETRFEDVKKSAATSTEIKVPEPPAKKPIRHALHDPRHAIPAYTPTKYGSSNFGKDLPFYLKLNNFENDSTVSAEINTRASTSSSTSHDSSVLIISSSAKNDIPSSSTVSNNVQGSTSSTKNSNSSDHTSDVSSLPLTHNGGEEKSPRICPRGFNYYSRYTSNQSKTLTHYSQPEDDDEEVSQEKSPIIRPRGFKHYLRYTSQPKFTTKQNHEKSDDLLLDSNKENSPSKPTEAKHELLVSARNNQFPTLQDPSSLSHVQPSLPSSSTPKSVRRRMLDVSENDSPPESKRQRKVRFVEAAVDNERPRRTITLATAIQPHFNIDNENEVNMEGTNPSNCRIAFPNQRGPCYKPPYQVLEKWVPSSDFKDFVVNGLGAFSNELHVMNMKEITCTEQSNPPEHLVIYDSMLTGIPFKKTYKRLETIKCAWPNNPL